jgi:hypothetical protein
MVAVLSSPLKCRLLIDYHERKVHADVADFLGAGNFLQDDHLLTTADKKERFEYQQEMNKRTKRNNLHVALSFSPGEPLNKQKLMNIARDYMDGIGFGRQPYLVYFHRDAGYPHMHVVSTNIQPDGKRIILHNLAGRKSIGVVVALEHRYGLIKRGEPCPVPLSQDIPLQNAPAEKQDVWRSIIRIVDHVWRTCLFTSFPEYNDALKQFHVRAETGWSRGRLQKSDGVVYRLLDARGQPLPGYVKASHLDFKPGLQALSRKYEENRLALADARLREQQAQKTIAKTPSKPEELAKETTRRRRKRPPL